MLKKLFSFLLIAYFGISFAVPGASAEESFQQDKFPYKEMQIQVMPEFDYPANWPKEEPSLLVGQYGTIINKTGKEYSGKIEVPVPAKEKNFQIYLVAEFPGDDKPEVQRPFELDKDKGVVTFTPEKSIKNDAEYKFVVEYYSNPIIVKDGKSFTYEYPAAADIETLDVIVYAPLKSTDIVLNPKPASTQKSEYGEQIAFYQEKAVKKGSSFKYNLSYKKEGNSSTLSMIDTSKAPNDENHSSGDGVTGGVAKNDGSGGDRPIIGTAGGVIIGTSIIIAGMFVFFGLRNKADNRRAPSSSSRKTNAKKPSAKPQKTNGTNVEEIKELRKKLLNGKIDQEAYEEQVKRLI